MINWNWLRRARPLLLLWTALMLAHAAAAEASDTGSISGGVFTTSGAPIAGATVRVSGDGLPMGRSVETDANGVYRIEYLLPGDYTVEIARADAGSATRTAIVSVGKDTQVDAILGVAVAESVTVDAATPIVDVRSSEVSTNVRAVTLETLPLDRTYQGLFQLIPGVADNRSSVGPAAGGTRQDNTYLIDGANITNPAFGYLGTEVNELDIVEVNLKRAGISAEFGRTGGTVTNAVSRSGSNRFTGIGRMDWLPAQLVDGYRLPDDLIAAGVKPGTFRDELLTTESVPAIGIGGPIVRDHVFFYGSMRYFREAKWDRVNKAGAALPDEIRSGSEYFGKITATPTPGHQLAASYRYRPNSVANGGLSSSTTPAIATATDNGSRIATADWTDFMSATRSFDIRYLYVDETNEAVPARELGYLPAFDPNDLASMGQYSDPDQANLTVGASQYATVQNYRRHAVKGTVSQFFDIGRTSHVFKAGAGYELAEETFNRLANGWGLLTSITQSGVPAIRARYYTPQPPQRGLGSTYSIFVQDEVTIANRVTANLGVLLDRDELSQRVDGSGGCPSSVTLVGGAAVYESHGDTCDFLRFGLPDQVQPRLGISYQLRPEKGDKAYASWGRYSNMDQKSSARSLAPSRIFQTQTVFGLDGGVLSSGPLASTTGKMIDPDIRPVYTNEAVIGYATPLGGAYSLDVYFMSRETHNFIEDVPSRLNGSAPDSGPFVAVNLPCARFAACQGADARRSYRAAVVHLRHRLADGWLSGVSYTWSRFEGNVDFDYSPGSIFNTSSFIQDGPGTNVDDPNRYGPLVEDRPHVFKMFTSYHLTSRLMTSGYLRVQSGTPWAARGRDWEGAVMNYLEPAGSHRNPAWTNLDLMVAYHLPAASTVDVSLEARVLNVFDNQERLSTDSQQYLDLRTLPAPPYFADYQQPNPFFATGNSFAPPRRLHLAAVLKF
jgi:hypothetical protein